MWPANTLIKFVVFVTCVGLACFLGACSTGGGAFHVQWGSASETGYPYDNEYGVKYEYRYYPSAGIYFDTARKVYFYLDGSDWQMAPSLPAGSAPLSGEYVIIEMDTDKPYMRHEEHKRAHPAD